MAELNFGLLTPPGSQSIGNAFVSGMDQAAVARAQENQNALSQYTLGKARREDELTSQLLGDLRVATTPEEIYRAYQRAGKPDVASKMQSERLTQDKLRGELKLQPVALAAAQGKLVEDKFKLSRELLDGVSTPEQYIAWHESNHADPVLGKVLSDRGVTVEQSRARIDAALQQPGGLERLINESKLGVAKFAEMNKPSNVQRNTGNRVETLSIPGMGGAATVVPGSQQFMQMTPGQVQTAADAKLSREQSEKQFNAGGYTYDLPQGVRYNRSGIAEPLLQQPAGGSAAPVGGGIPTGRNAAGLVPVGVRPEKPDTSYYKEVKGVINTNDAINELKKMVINFTPTDMLNPARRAEIDTAHKTAVLLSKEMFNLGVLNGGDQKILEQVIPDPIAFSKGLVPIETIRKNLDAASNVVSRMNNTLSRVHKQPLLILDAVTPNKPSPSAPPIQSFRPSPEGRP